MTNKQLKSILVFFGMTASGKSYLSTAWAKKYGCLRLNTDVVRKECIAWAEDKNTAGMGIERGIYSPEYTFRTYAKMLTKAEEAMDDFSVPCVVLDGSYQQTSERRRLLEHFHGRASISFIFCSCSETVTRVRLALRLQDSTAVSDGNLQIYLHQLRKFEKPTEIPTKQLLELDTDAPLEYLIGCLERFLTRADAGNSQ